MADVDGNPDAQIRDRSFPIKTTSLVQAGNEPVPDEMFRDLIDREWIETEAAKRPKVLVKDDALQWDLRLSDLVMIEVENYQEQPTGHRHEFVDLEVPLAITIRSAVSRQRVWNVMAECRRITYRWMLAFQPYQVLYFDGFQPDYVGANQWQGVMRVRLTAGTIPVIGRFITGEEDPASSPGMFPDGVPRP